MCGLFDEIYLEFIKENGVDFVKYKEWWRKNCTGHMGIDIFVLNIMRIFINHNVRFYIPDCIRIRRLTILQQNYSYQIIIIYLGKVLNIVK